MSIVILNFHLPKCELFAFLGLALAICKLTGQWATKAGNPKNAGKTDLKRFKLLLDYCWNYIENQRNFKSCAQP